jgi:hypothetical protein
MDKRITEKIKKLNDEADERARQEVLKKQELEAWHAKRVKDSMPAARKWVEERLLDIIAETVIKNKGLQPQYQDKELSLYYCDPQNNENRNIPEEAKYLAAQEIEGLIVRKVWAPASQNPNDETGGTWDKAGYEYYVSWKQP